MSMPWMHENNSLPIIAVPFSVFFLTKFLATFLATTAQTENSLPYGHRAMFELTIISFALCSQGQIFNAISIYDLGLLSTHVSVHVFAYLNFFNIMFVMRLNHVSDYATRKRS